MKFTTIATGSSGNCYLLDDGESKLLIECGITFKEIQKSLNFETSDLVGCLVTHCHGDHTKGIKTLLQRGIDVYMTEEEQVALDLENVRLRSIKNKVSFRVGSYTVLPFDIQHDTPNPCGFFIQSDNGKRMIFATDTYYIRYKFPGVHIMAVECNYDEQTLKYNVEQGYLHKSLMKRVVKSHMSLENLLTFFKSNDLSKVEEIHLLHLSNGNGDEKRIYEEVSKATGKQIFIP